jgi:hypothetical protein
VALLPNLYATASCNVTTSVYHENTIQHTQHWCILGAPAHIKYCPSDPLLLYNLLGRIAEKRKHDLSSRERYKDSAEYYTRLHVDQGRCIVSGIIVPLAGAQSHNKTSCHRKNVETTAPVFVLRYTTSIRKTEESLKRSEVDCKLFQPRSSTTGYNAQSHFHHSLHCAMVLPLSRFAIPGCDTTCSFL